MCVVSAVTDYFQNKWVTPAPIFHPFQPDGTGFIWITKEQWEDYQNLKRIAEQYDTRTDQPDCIKPDLAAFELKVEKTLVARGVLEAAKEE